MGRTYEATEHRFMHCDEPTKRGAIRLQRAARRERARELAIVVPVRAGRVDWRATFTQPWWYGDVELPGFGDFNGYLLVDVYQYRSWSPPDYDEEDSVKRENARDYLAARERAFTRAKLISAGALSRRP